MGVQCGGSGNHLIAFNFNVVEATAHADHHATNSAIADDEVGAHAHDENWHFGVERSKERSQIIGIGGLKEPVGRPAHAHPCQVCQGAVLGQGSPRRGQLGGHWRGLFVDFGSRANRRGPFQSA